MAVVYPGSGPLPDGGGAPAPSTGSRLVSFAEQHIVLAAVFLIGLALAIGYLVNKVRGGAASASSAANQQPQTLYVPTSNTFENVYTTTDSGNTVTNTTPPTSPGGSAGPTFPITATVRQAIASSPYDKQYGGVAVFATPATNAFGGHNTGFVPFGSSIQLLSQTTGTPYSDSSGGSSTYYLTPQGYISAQDVVLPGSSGGSLNTNPQDAGLVQPATGSGDPFQDGHLPALRTIFSANHGISHHLNHVLGT